jgi:hypothetical protein
MSSNFLNQEIPALVHESKLEVEVFVIAEKNLKRALLKLDEFLGDMHTLHDCLVEKLQGSRLMNARLATVEQQLRTVGRSDVKTYSSDGQPLDLISISGTI